MKIRKSLFILTVLLLSVWLLEESAQARKKHRRYTGPTPTHPVILWSRTVEESKDAEQRKVAAFKLSQYSQPIFQPKVVTTLLTCAKDADEQIKVLCTKALRRAKSASQEGAIRDLLIGQYGSDPMLRNTIVRTLVARKDDNPAVQKLLQEALLKTEETEELLVLLRYFEEFVSTDQGLSEKLVELYDKRSDVKARRAIVKVISVRGTSQDKVIELLAKCAQEKDTPLALNCLSGLQSQAKKDSRAWAAVSKTIQSKDPDVLLATLDVINALPETKNTEVTRRLLGIVEDVEDPDIVERAVLALGVCGDQSEETVKTLQKVFQTEKTEEAVRIAAALTLGKQAATFPEGIREMLTKCAKDGSSQTLKSACQLGINELGAAPTAKAPVTTPKENEKS